MFKTFDIVAKFAIAMVILVPLVFLKSLVAMLAWNCVVPDIFGAQPLTLLQAFALCTLCYVLLGNTSASFKKGDA